MKYVLIFLSLFFWFGPALAEWPERPIRIITPFAAGNGSDIAARKFAEKIEQKLNIKVYIENKPGGGGKIGINEVKRSTPDGYTFLYTPSFFISLIHLQKNSDYELENFQPISLLVNHVFLIGGQVNVSEIDLIKKKKEIYYCSVGYGSPTHLTTLQFLKKYNLKGISIPYKTSNEALIDLKEQRIDICAMPESLLSNYKQENFIEIYNSVSVNNWNGLFAPKNTPKHIVEKLSNILNEIKNDQELIEWSNRVKIKIADKDTPNDFIAFLKKYENNIKETIEEFNLEQQ